MVQLDATYFGRNAGVLVALEAGTGRLLYMEHIGHEHASDYVAAISPVSACGYEIKGVVTDGMASLFSALSAHPIQMCQFHRTAIIRRKLTRSPRLPCGKELLALAYSLGTARKEDSTGEFEAWKEKWKDFLAEQTTVPETSRRMYTHRRIRSAKYSLEHYMEWLFTHEQVEGMPNTNNLVEGTFTDLKRNLRNHPGMGEAGRKKFIDGFFEAYATRHNSNGEESENPSP